MCNVKCDTSDKISKTKGKVDCGKNIFRVYIKGVYCCHVLSVGAADWVK